MQDWSRQGIRRINGLVVGGFAGMVKNSQKVYRLFTVS
jgi:hypothetical protein